MLTTWLKGLLAAVIGAVANSATLTIVDPQTFNITDGQALKRLGAVAATSGLLSLAMYLKQSPLPDLPLRDK